MYSGGNFKLYRTMTKEQANGGGLTQVGIHELMRLMIEQNRIRDEQINNVLSQLTNRPVTPSPSSLPDTQSKLITVFNGETGEPEVANEWITALETTALLNQWSDPYTLEVARSHLDGPAKNWFLTHSSELKTWESFLSLFKRMFTVSEGVVELWKRMYDRNQQPGESVFTYFHDKMRLCRRIKLDEAETKKMCIGLSSS